MKVHIERTEETSGIFKKTTMYVVKCRVEFTPEEAKIIKDTNIDDAVVYRYPSPIDPDVIWTCEIKQFFTGHRRQFSTLADARVFEQELKETYLPNIKSYIEANNAPSQAKDSFEL